MKNILFLIVFCININVSCKTPPKTKDIKISDFVGKWYYSANDETLTLNLESTKNNGIIGKYCNIAYNGNRIDCSPDDEKNIAGVLKNDTLYLKFTGFYDESAYGEAKLYKENDSCLVWILGKSKGDFYLPEEAMLKRPPLQHEDNMDCNDKLSLLITSSLNYVTDQNLNDLKAVIDRQDKNEYYVRLYNKFTTKDISLIKLNIENKTLIDYTDKYNEKVLKYEDVFYNSAVSCFGLKAIEAKTEEKEVDSKLIEKFEMYYQHAPMYKTSGENSEEEEIEMMEIPLDMCSFFNITATKLYLWKLRPKNKIKVCLLYVEISPDNSTVIFYTLSNENKIIDKLPIGEDFEKKGIVSEYAVDYINGENVIYTDKTDGQKVFNKKEFRITLTGQFEEIK
ncbi:hypothetical protein ACIXSV_20165 [Bacteroides fragilis]